MVALSCTSPTVSEAIRLGLNAMRLRCRPSTMHAVQVHGRRFDRLWGSRLLSELSVTDFHAYIQERRHTATNSTIRHELAFMSAIFNNSIELGVASLNPIPSVKKKNLRINTRCQWLTDEEEGELKSAYLAFERWPDPSGGTDEQRASLEWDAVRFAILTGARRGEQMALTRAHFTKHTVTLDGKTGPRVVPLHPQVPAIVQRWLAHPSRKTQFIFWPWVSERRSTWADRCVYQDAFKRICRQVGLNDLHWHDLRRTFGCRLIERGVPIFEVQKLLGHSSPTMTMIYCQVGLTQLSASVAKLQ